MRGFNPRDRLFQPDLQLECEGQRERTWYLRGIKPPLSGGGGRSYAFLPTDIPGLVDWHRSDLGITLVGSKVSVWADQSGQGHDLAQSTDANRPTYVADVIGGKPVLRFGPTAGEKILSWSLWAVPQACTIYAVIRMRTTTDDQLFLEASGVHPFLYLGVAGSAVNQPCVYESGVRAASAALSDQTAYLVKWEFDYSDAVNESYATQVNASAEATASTSLSLNAGNFVGVGRSDGTQDLISDTAEILVYSRRLSPSEEEQVRIYVRGRYAILM